VRSETVVGKEHAVRGLQWLGQRLTASDTLIQSIFNLAYCSIIVLCGSVPSTAGLQQRRDPAELDDPHEAVEGHESASGSCNAHYEREAKRGCKQRKSTRCRWFVTHWHLVDFLYRRVLSV
jgi:hypothetical protein